MHTKLKTLSALAIALCPLALTPLAAQTTRTVIEYGFDAGDPAWTVPNFSATTAASPWSTTGGNQVGSKTGTETTANYIYSAALPETIELKNVGDWVEISLDAVFTSPNNEFKLGFTNRDPAETNGAGSAFQGYFRTANTQQIGMYLPDTTKVYDDRQWGAGSNFTFSQNDTVYKLAVRLEMTSSGLVSSIYIDGGKVSTSGDAVSVTGSWFVSQATFQVGGTSPVGLQLDNIKVTTNVAASIPEPSTVALLASGVVLLLAGLARRRFCRA
ncbi:glycosyltransferase family 1 [Opitutaceae bacterium TAV5]|nr:glycosyltransferase family 1 [Opitutaceae bacterium TAV5]